MSWPLVALGDLGKWFGGATPSKSRLEYWTDGTIPWLSPKDMGPAVLTSTQDLITDAAVAGSSVRVIPGGFVAVVVRSGILERTIPVAIVPFDATLNQDMKAVVPRPDVDARWIAWGLRAYERELLRDTRKAGTTVASIEWPRFNAFKLPLPPLDEQRRIVGLLEDHLSRLDAAVCDLAATARRTELWHSQVANELIWSKNYPCAVIGGLLRERMRNGRSDRAASDSEIGIRTLTLTAVTKNAFTEENTKHTVTTADRAAGLWLEPGDIFVQRANTPELVGTTARYSGHHNWAIFPDLLIRLRPDENKIDGRYLTAALRSEAGHNQLRRKAKGLAGSMPKIDQTAIASATVPLPELDEQRRIVKRIELTVGVADELQSALARADKRAASLRRSLLAAAFSGRLTATSPELPESDEKIFL